MSYVIIDTGGSRSFPAGDSFLAGASKEADVVVLIGKGPFPEVKAKRAVLLELGTECLGVHTGESRGDEGSNVLGFARFRLGEAPPSNLVELVRQPKTDPAALAAQVEVVDDRVAMVSARILSMIVNEAAFALMEGVARPADIDMAMKQGYLDAPDVKYYGIGQD